MIGGGSNSSATDAGGVVFRNKPRPKNEWRSSFENRKSLWEQKSSTPVNHHDLEARIRPHSFATAAAVQVS